MNTSYANDMYDQHLQRSPGTSLRHQQPRDLPRQNSRQFNGYADHQPNPYQLGGLDENARYDAPRYDSRQGAATLHSGYAPQHDFSSASIWNNGGAANYGGNNTMSGITSRMKGQNRGRSNLPQVSCSKRKHYAVANIFCSGLGWAGSSATSSCCQCWGVLWVEWPLATGNRPRCLHSS